MLNSPRPVPRCPAGERVAPVRAGVCTRATPRPAASSRASTGVRRCTLAAEDDGEPEVDERRAWRARCAGRGAARSGRPAGRRAGRAPPRPAAGENTSSPVAETDSPATPVRYSGTATSTAARVDCCTNTPVALRSQRISTSSRGSMNGCVRRSPVRTKRPAQATPSAHADRGQPRGTPGCGAAVAAVISRATPTVSVPAPTQSIRVRWPLSRGTTRRDQDEHPDR